MATKNAIMCADPTEVPCGGTGNSSFSVTYAVLCAGTTSTGALQTVASIGSAGQVLTSNGAGSLPTFQNASTTNIAPTVTATAPTQNGEIFYDTATDTFVGYDGSEVTFTTT